MNTIFKRSEILLPKNSPEKWAVIACDQFTSSPEYWEKLSEETKGCPSALNIIFPEVYLNTVDNAAKAEEINGVMRDYLAGDVFRALPDSYVFVKRTLPSGKVRRGIVGALDLDAYDYKAGSASPVRCTEGTIESRLPPRVAIRKDAPLELPHILVFYDDPEGKINALMESLSENETPAYDCELLMGGGHVKGYEISGEKADSFEKLTGEMYSDENLRDRFGGLAPVIFAMGDGNHSLATAKQCRSLKLAELGEEKAANHPSRYALVELVNIHDEAIGFEPIHRVLFNVDADKAFSALKEGLEALSKQEGEKREVSLVSESGEEKISLSGCGVGEIISRADEIIAGVLGENGTVDYIHNDETALSFGKQKGNLALMLPVVTKDSFFDTIAKYGPFPKKTFSIGRAEEKRYYMECRKI